MRAFRAAGALAVQQVRDSAVSVEGASEEETKDLLRKCAATTLNSKLVRARGPGRVVVGCLVNVAAQVHGKPCASRRLDLEGLSSYSMQ